MKLNQSYQILEPVQRRIRVKDTQKAFRKLGDMNGNEKVVEDLTKVMVEHIFYDIIKNLKHAAENDEKEVITAAETIFNHN